MSRNFTQYAVHTLSFDRPKVTIELLIVEGVGRACGQRGLIVQGVLNREVSKEQSRLSS